MAGHKSTLVEPQQNASSSKGLPLVRVAAYLVFFVGWVGALSLFLGVCVRYAQFRHSGPDECAARRSNDGFRGNPDFYGLGIRLGIYLQWLASFIATAVLQDLQRQLAGAYIGAQIALLSAFLALIFQDACTFTAEAIVILYFLLGGIVSVLGQDLVAGCLGFRESRNLRLYDFFPWLLVCLVSTISSWFWLRLAIVGEVDFVNTPGDTSMFFIAHIGPNGLLAASICLTAICLTLAIGSLEKIFWLLISKAIQGSAKLELPPILSLLVLSELGYLFLMLAMLLLTVLEKTVSFLCTIFKLVSNTETGDTDTMPADVRKRDARNSSTTHASDDSSSRDRGRESSSGRGVGWKKVLSFLVKILSIPVSFIAMILSILAVELTVAWNHISGVHSIASTGQIIPLVLGITLVITVLWNIWELRIKKRHKQNPASGTTEHNQDGNDCSPTFNSMGIGFQGLDGKWV